MVDSKDNEDGLRPDLEQGPGEASPGVERCQDEATETEHVQDCDFKAEEEVHEQFPVEEIPCMIDPVDGLLTPITPEIGNAIAPPFAYETVICIEDDREYVEVFEEEVDKALFDMRTKLDLETTYDSEGRNKKRRTFQPEQVVRRWGFAFARTKESALVPVRPKRPRCRFYKRQVFNNEEQPDPNQPGHQIIFRNCTARRSNGGSFMSLRDEAVYCCDYRDPPCEESTKKQDERDREKLVNRPHEVKVPLFNLEGGERHES